MPAEQVYRSYIEQKIIKLCELYGYARINTPTFEDTRLFARSVHTKILSALKDITICIAT